MRRISFSANGILRSAQNDALLLYSGCATMPGVISAVKCPLLALAALAGLVLVACVPMPVPTLQVPTLAPTPPPVTTAQSVLVVPTPTPSATAVLTATRPVTEPLSEPITATLTLTATPVPTPLSFWQQRVTNLFDLARLPLMENSSATQFTSRNWVSLEHYFDYFIDDGNFAGPNYGYLDENGHLQHYRIVTGYLGTPEYEIVPRVQGPGEIERIWFAYQQHQSVNNPQDMSQLVEWNNWGNLGAMGNIRFYFDDEPTPRLDVGIKDLFDGTSPFPAPLAAFYASADGGNINYVPIPFEHSIRITTTGRPRLMQIEVKQFRTGTVPTGDPLPVLANAVQPPLALQPPAPVVSPPEQAVLDQAVQAWNTCTPRLPGEFQPYSLEIPHNQSTEVDFNSPGTIAGLRISLPRGMEDSVWMQVFWDGDTEPSLIAPLRGMFGTQERLLPYRALPMGTYFSGDKLVFYNYIPMPFQSARLVLINDRAETLPVTVEVVLQETLPGTEQTRLHAFYGTRRMIQREDDQDNYAIIDVKGRGKFLGMIFSAWDLDRRALNGPLDEKWRFPYLESNVDVWTDGRMALPGTGIEDDFNASYYYVFAGYEGYKTTYCLAGVTLLEYGSYKEPSSQYRFYLNDAPEFREHLHVEVQHGNKGNNLSVTYSSTAFWYLVK